MLFHSFAETKYMSAKTSAVKTNIKTKHWQQSDHKSKINLSILMIRAFLKANELEWIEKQLISQLNGVISW